MNERLRQRYLKLMGFTPWVAVTALPGAAPSPLRDAGVVDDELDEVTNVTASDAPAVPDLSALLADTSAGQVAVPAMQKKRTTNLLSLHRLTGRWLKVRSR